MSEMVKTVVCVASALLISAVAFFTRPRSMGDEPSQLKGTQLFAKFDDPYAAKSLEIIRFNEDLGQIQTFEVAQKAGQWVIPSHEDYPADAETQLKDAATALVDLKIISIASKRVGDHELYGVIEPDTDKTQLGDKGVGMLVALRDARGDDLATLIIGKKVRGTEDQRYVRMPGNDVVYYVKADPEKFSTKFEDWIEKDLLKLSAWDIQQVALKDYSVDVGPTPDGRLGVTNYEQRLEMSIKWNSKDYKWELDELKEFQDDELRPSQLQPDEELNKETLDALKDALDELEIVDVERKPAGLRADLKAEKGFLNDNEGVRSLIERGFYPVPLRPGELELLSSNGEVQVTTKEGVEYLLRFGQIAGIQTGENEGKLNRYVFVTARVDEKSFPYPELESLPQEDPQATQPPPLNEIQNSSEAQSPSSSGEKSSQTQSNQASSQAENADEQSSAEETPDSQEDKEDKNKEKNNDNDKEDVEDQRERIVKENERKLNEYKEKKKKAEDKVKELNFRFADWYYVISEDVYKKIHLGRGDVVKKKESTSEKSSSEDKADSQDGPSSAEEDAFDIESLRKLEEQGLEGDKARSQAQPGNENP